MKGCLLAVLLLLVTGAEVAAAEDATPTERIKLEVTTASESQDTQIGTTTDTVAADTPEFQQDGLHGELPVDQPAVVSVSDGVIQQETAQDGETSQTALTQPIAQIQPIIQNPELLQTINAGAEQTVPVVQPELPQQVVEGMSEVQETVVVSDPLASSVQSTSINNLNTNAVMVEQQQQPEEIAVIPETTSELVTSQVDTTQSTLPSTDTSSTEAGSSTAVGSSTVTNGVITPPVNYNTTSELTTSSSTSRWATTPSTAEEGTGGVLAGYVVEEHYQIQHDEQNSAEAGMEKELIEEEEELTISTWTDTLATTQVIAVILVVMTCIIVLYILFIAKKKSSKRDREREYKNLLQDDSDFDEEKGSRTSTKKRYT